MEEATPEEEAGVDETGVDETAVDETAVEETADDEGEDTGRVEVDEPTEEDEGSVPFRPRGWK